MNEQQRLYAELETITGGLPAFLNAVRDETWELEPYEPFSLTTISPEIVAFGFHRKINGDLVSDPQLWVRIDLAARTATVFLADTLTGSFREPGIPAGTETYAANLLQEMRHRRAVNTLMQVRVWEATEGVAA